jgi:hypothetical protein
MDEGYRIAIPKARRAASPTKSICHPLKIAHRTRPMNHRGLLLLVLAFLAFGSARGAAPAPDKEYVILTGGVSLYEWEKFKAQPHDHWWANFVHASRVRFDQLRAQNGPDARITWLVYKPAYIRRGLQEGRDLTAMIESVRDAEHLNLVWFDKADDMIAYLNSGQDRTQVKIADFEYFGHSNKACFMFDYSNQIDSASKCWLHETDLTKIKRDDFARGAFVKSWGCHTGEEMSSYWHAATGTRMWGAIGRTDYSQDQQVVLCSPGGHWVN